MWYHYTEKLTGADKMIKKFSVLLVLVLFVSCSNIQTQNSYQDSNRDYQRLYENWKLNELENQLKFDSQKYGKNTTIVYYEKALNDRKRDRENLDELLTKIKNEFKENKKDTLENSLNMIIKGAFVKEELNKVDLSQMRVSYTKPTFYKNSAENIVAFRINEETIYFNIVYELKNGIWKIIEFKERR